MHRPAQAAQELRRAVRELGLVGAILNDWQATGQDGNGILLYDTPDFDPFWEAVQELDVPVYFHPKVRLFLDWTKQQWPNPNQMETIYENRRWLMGATCQFHVQLSIHIQAMIQGGVFDRFPGAKIIVGHLGENLVHFPISWN
jgi:2,3-dihydroxybenzoate decarboxylase